MADEKKDPEEEEELLDYEEEEDASGAGRVKADFERYERYFSKSSNPNLWALREFRRRRRRGGFNGAR